MNVDEFNVLVESGNVNLAAAYGILMNCGESALLHGFQDIVNITNRVKIAERLIENERNSRLKEKIIKRIMWYKCNITSLLTDFKGKYATIVVAERSEDGYMEDFYERVVKVIDAKKEYEDFYAWIEAINRVEWFLQKTKNKANYLYMWVICFVF